MRNKPILYPAPFFQVFFLLLLTTCQSVSSTGTPVLSTLKAQTLVSGVTKGKVTVLKTFAGPSGLTGILINEKAHRLAIVYSTKDGETLIAGTLFDQNGTNLTKESADAFLVAKKTSAVQKTPLQDESSGGPRITTSRMNAVENNTTYVSQGKGTRILWIFFDPNCIWCHRLFLLIHDHPVPNTIQIRWIPVGFLKPGSTGKAVAILKNGLDTLIQDEMNFDTENEEGGAPILHSDSLGALVKRNNLILKRLGDGNLETPTLVYREKGVAYMFPGFPEREEWGEIIKNISP